MTYLLDTHYLIWAITDTTKISRKIRETIVDPENRILVSAISIWEIASKFSLGKLTIEGFSPEDLPAICDRMGFETAPLSATIASTYNLLTSHHHKDPFDRMLIWEALSNNYTLVSADPNMKQYVSDGLRLLT